MSPLTAIFISFVAGSIPAALIAGKMRGVDLRAHGSGNLGATNVARVLGARAAIAVFAFDVLKGALPVLLLPARTVSPSIGWLGANPQLPIAIACGVAAILGHLRPIFLGFGKGGKGVATATGVFVALAPIPTLLTFIVFTVTVLTSGYVSLGSILSALVLPLLLAVTFGPQSWLAGVGIVVALLIVWMHRSNIRRLVRGEEDRFGRKNVLRRNSATTAAVVGTIVLALFLAAQLA
jgi:glycerol-3-phosphate acyltransferase PlsY